MTIFSWWVKEKKIEEKQKDLSDMNVVLDFHEEINWERKINMNMAMNKLSKHHHINYIKFDSIYVVYCFYKI